MPNMFGGDQFHPAYDPTTKVGENQVLIGNTLYTANPDGTATYEDVDGTTGRVPMPDELKAKLKGNDSGKGKRKN